MNEDLEIKKLFSDYQPEMTDSQEFLSALEKKLDAVDEVKVYQKFQTRKYRRLSFIALIAGAVFGGLLVAFVLLAPATLGQFHLLLDSSFYVFIMTYRTWLLLAGSLMIAGACCVPILKSHTI